jgi:Bacterial PH domain
VKRRPPTRQFRYPSAITVGAVIAMIAGLSVATWQPWLLVLLLVPLAIAVWSWRAGTDVDPDGLTVRAALGRRRLPWSQVVGLETGADRRVSAVLSSGGRVALTAVKPTEVPHLVEAAGGRLGPAQVGEG